MLKLQLQNVGQATIVVKDLEGYTGFVAQVATGVTSTYEVSRDLVQRLAPRLRDMETPVLDVDGTVLVGLRWAVLAGTSDDRAMDEGLAGLPSLTELQAANYSTGAGATDVVAVGTGLLGNQAKASLAVVLGAAQLDLEAVTPGGAGNDISFIVGTPAGGANVVAVVGSQITVTPKAGGDTVANIAAAINADTDALLLVQATVGAAGNIDAAIAEANLAGGVGDGVSLSLGGTACSITALTDTQITFDAVAGISTATYWIPLEYRNGPHVSRITVLVAA